MATPAIAALRNALPDARIDMAVGEWSRPAVANNPRLNSLLNISVEAKEGTPASLLRAARYIRRGEYGTALVLDRSPLLNSVARMAGVPVRAGLDSNGRGLALTHPVPCPPGAVRHEVEWYLDVVRALGIPAPSERALEFYPTEAASQAARHALDAALGMSEAGASGGEERLVALHLGGGSNPGMQLPAKRWQPQRWAQVADWLAETYQSNILLLGGPGEDDRAAAEAFKAALFPATRTYVGDLVGKLTWDEMGALLKLCDLFLGHDTGAMHLATAVQTPVVAVFGPSDPARYGPWDPSGRSVVVAPPSVKSDAEALRRASAQGEPYHSMVSAEEVWAAVQRVYKLRLHAAGAS